MCKYLLRSSVFWCAFSLSKQTPHGLEMSSEERTPSILCPEFDELGEPCSLVCVECSQCCWHLVAGTRCCFVSAAFGALLCHFSFSHTCLLTSDRKGEGERRARNINDERILSRLPLARPLLGTEPTTPGMCPHWELNCDFLVHRSRLRHWATLARQALCHFSWGWIEACHLSCLHLSLSPSSSSCVCYWQYDSLSNVKLGGRITDLGLLCA